MNSCWESGGPDWLFGAVLASIIVAAVAAVWWGTARSPPPGRGPRLRRVTSYLVHFAIFTGVLAAVSGFESFAWAMAFVAALLAAASWVIAEALRRQQFAADDGRELAGGWGMAHRTIRPGVPTLFLVAVASAVGFMAASVLLGHPCA